MNKISMYARPCSIKCRVHFQKSCKSSVEFRASFFCLSFGNYYSEQSKPLLQAFDFLPGKKSQNRAGRFSFAFKISNCFSQLNRAIKFLIIVCLSLTTNCNVFRTLIVNCYVLTDFFQKHVFPHIKITVNNNNINNNNNNTLLTNS